ncbi:unnamed protein product [Linum tenue]|uniref:FRIGIDA-like protein n=1 Tax=Linum tenue TaxID=586396 RepID=A0AAV0QV15_9ROSI|nr:unnamed protein product [Linum tenue]
MATPSVSNAGAPATGHSPRQSTVALVKAETVSGSPPQGQLQHPNPHVKSEQVEVNDLPIVTLPPQQPEQPRSQVLESVQGLCNLSSAILEFKSRFDELEKHLDLVRTAIESHEQPHGQVDGEAVALVPSGADGAVPASSELLNLCEAMCGKSLRKYIITRLDNVQKLREELPSALKSAPQPARLVLDCIGRFYLQGSKAYAKNSPMVPGREACVLALELFLLMAEGEVQLEEHVRQEAVQAAMNWRKRLVVEGGIRKASEIDAKGLLLFVAAYGIPKLFKNEDIWDLVLAGNAGQVAEALRKSTVLVSRVTEIIEQAMTSATKQNAKLEAVDVASSFGIDDKFPPQKLLTAYLRESKEALKKRRREANSLPMLLKQANDRHLSSLASVMKFLEDRKLDPLKVVPGWQLTEKITKLEKENADLNKKIMDKAMIKRRADLNDITTNQAMKRPRGIGQGASTGSASIGGLHEHKAAAAAPYMSPYNNNTSLRVNHPLGAYGGDTYPCATSAPLYSSAGVPENAVMHGGAVNHHQGVYNLPATSASAGNVANGLRWETVVDRAGHMVANNSSLAYAAQGGQSYVSRHGTYGLFGPSPSIEGFPGLPNSPPPGVGAATATNPADLYRFADSVVETEYNSRGGWCHQ